MCASKSGVGRVDFRALNSLKTLSILHVQVLRISRVYSLVGTFPSVKQIRVEVGFSEKIVVPSPSWAKDSWLTCGVRPRCTCSNKSSKRCRQRTMHFVLGARHLVSACSESLPLLHSSSGYGQAEPHSHTPNTSKIRPGFG